VTEKEWLESSDPAAMLDFLQGTASSRKLRLFACACCRRVWPHFRDDIAWRAVEVAERYADLLANHDELVAAADAVDVLVMETLIRDGAITLAFATAKAASGAANMENEGGDPVTAAERAAFAVYRAGFNATHGIWEQAYYLHLDSATRDNPEIAAQCELLRCVFGNPFNRASPDLFALGLAHRELRPLARSIYEEQAFARLPILAESLEDADCSDAAILAHCRGSGPHVRGCWVVDLLLGKE